MNTTSTSFQEWFDKKKENGLTDFKLAISSTDVPNREVQAELMNIQALVDGNRTTKLPSQSVSVSKKADEIICRRIGDM